MIDPALDYVRHVLAVRGWTPADLARNAGVAHSTINRPLTDPDHGTALSRRTISKIFEATGISPDKFILGYVEAPVARVAGVQAADGSAALVPVYDISASAGDGSFVVHEQPVSSLAFPKDYLRRLTRANPQDLAIIGVKGDSMLPTLADDDVVMLDTSKQDLSYDGLFVIRDNGDALLVKRIGRASQPGCVTIISDNRQLYASVEKALTDIEVVGRVIWTGGKV